MKSTAKQHYITTLYPPLNSTVQYYSYLRLTLFTHRPLYNNAHIETGKKKRIKARSKEELSSNHALPTERPQGMPRTGTGEAVDPPSTRIRFDGG